MITEDYVSFELAQLLKEKGFDGQCATKYDSNGCIWDNIRYDGIFLGNNDIFPEEYLSPTLQMAMKWLREVHNVFIDISSRFSKNADSDVCFSYSCKKLIDTYKSSYEIGDGEWLNYEEACEAAIKYCLEHLI